MCENVCIDEESEGVQTVCMGERVCLCVGEGLFCGMNKFITQTGVRVCVCVCVCAHLVARHTETGHLA